MPQRHLISGGQFVIIEANRFHRACNQQHKQYKRIMRQLFVLLGLHWLVLHASVTFGQVDVGVTIRPPPADELQAGVPFQLSILVTNAGPDAPTMVWMYNHDTYRNFIAVAHYLSQGQVIEFRDGQMPWRVHLGSIPPQGVARLALTLIPKRSGALRFSSEVGCYVQEPEEGLPNRGDVLLAVSPGPGIVAFGTVQSDWLESDGQALLEVRRQEGSAGTVQVSYATEDGSAIAGQDYIATSGTLTFLAGETNKSFVVPLLNNTQTDCNRQFSVRLLNPLGGALLYGVTNVTLSILEDDLIPFGELTAVSIATNGLSTGDGTVGSAVPTISANGRWVAFASRSGDLVHNDTNGLMDVFVRDLWTGKTEVVSINAVGMSGNGHSSYPAISADGRWVAFATEATDLVTNAIPPNSIQTVARDLLTGQTQLISVTPEGVGAEGQSALAGVRSYNGNLASSISSNGQVVLFLCEGRGLIPGYTNPVAAYYVRDLAAQTTELVTINKDNTGPITDDIYFEAALSANGRRVVIKSKSRELVVGFGNGLPHIYLRDLTSGITAPVDMTLSGEAGGHSGAAVISADGRYVAFTGGNNQLVSGDDNPNSDIFVRDVDAGVTYRASAGLYVNCHTPSLSTDGRFVVFREGDIPSLAASQIYVRDCWSNTLTLVSVNCTGTDFANRHARNPVISTDGRHVVFQSFASDLVPGRFFDGVISQYHRDLLTGRTTLISMNRTLTGGLDPTGVFGGIGFSYPALSADGTVVAYASNARDLVWGDGNGVLDVFVWRAAYPYQSGPRLQITREGSEAVLRWPRDASAYTLQTTPDLNSVNWTDVPGNGTNEHRIPPVGQQFFRLRRVD